MKPMFVTVMMSAGATLASNSCAHAARHAEATSSAEHNAIQIIGSAVLAVASS